MASELAIVGVGNILWRDEGVGVFAAHYLRDNYSFNPPVQVIDGAMLGFALIDLFTDGTRLLDAMLTDAAPGTVFRLPGHELLDLGPDMVPTAHEVDPIHQFKQADLLGVDMDMSMVAVVPQDAEQMGLGLTPELHEAFPAFIEAALAELDSWGITLTRTGDADLDAVVESLVEGVR
jgi:hydrogenase maturation protease